MKYLKHMKHPADLSMEDWNLYLKAKRVLWSINSIEQIGVAKLFIDRAIKILCPITVTDKGHVRHNEEIENELRGIWRAKATNPQVEDPFKITNKDQKDGKG